jgi:O-antigen ligase
MAAARGGLRDPRSRVFGAALALAVLGSALLLDPYAQASFDAPQRLAALAGGGIALAALVWRPVWPSWWQWPLSIRAMPLLLLTALGLTLLSTLAAAQPPRAWDSLRGLALFALFLPLGAARWLDGAAGRRLLTVAVAAVLVNCLLSLAQAAGLALPLPVARLGGRFPTGALLGNEAFVAQAAALLGAGCCAIVTNASKSTWRTGAAGLLVVCIAVIAVNRQATSAVALAAAALIVLLIRFGAARLAAAGALLAVLLAMATALAPLRAPGAALLPAATLENVQNLTTYRLGAWAAALEMIRAQPWLGHGPGSYADQSQQWRLRAELRGQVRLPPPPTATGFAQAHQEYLQFAAEAGLPALAALLAALALLLRGLARRARTDLQAAVLLAVLSAAAITALAWFPLQVPFLAVLLLLAAGRAWRRLADAEATA